MNNFDFGRIKLNTLEFEQWLCPNWRIEDNCKQVINWELLDSYTEDFFSIQNKKLAFWENYKDNNQIEIVDSNWDKKNINIPTIINWWMGTNVSSGKLVEAMNKLWFWGHLSSIWIGFYYYYEKFPDLFKDNFNWKDSLKEQVQKDFSEIFKWKLWLSDEFINKHFFQCDDLWINEKNTWFNGELWRERVSRMMDLVTLYDKITNLKANSNNVWINCMYKTSSYIAALKISILSGIDYITTAAWNPAENPKEFLKDFYEDLKNSNIQFSVPAFWLLVSSWRAKVFNDFDYDYYIFEQWDKAWGHIIRLWDKFEELEKIKELFRKKWINIPPIYAAWWVSSNKEIKEAFDAWFDWIQLWTIPAVSEEACDGDWEKLKKRLIWGNHLWENSDIDLEYFSETEKVERKFEELVLQFNEKILSNLSQENWVEYTLESPEIARVMDYIYKVVYNDFFGSEIKDFESLNDDEKELYQLIKKFIFESNNWDIKKINKILRNYWNAKKFAKELDKYIETNWVVPTHIVFDSTVWFPWRMKITENIEEIISGAINSNWCVNCLTDCILAGRWNVREDRGSTFCIYDRLNYHNKERNIAFSWRSTVPYDEIRPIKDLMAYLMGTYVKR